MKRVPAGRCAYCSRKATPVGGALVVPAGLVHRTCLGPWLRKYRGRPA